MRKIFLLIFLFSFSTTLYATPLLSALNYVLQAPPKTEDTKSLYNYLNTIYSKWNQIQITTQEPNSNITGNYGQLIIYNNSGTYYLAVETSNPSGTAWSGVKLGAV